MATTKKVNETENPVETTEEQVVAPEVEETENLVEDAPKAGKVYRFTSKNPFLSCVSLGVQFVGGKASTEDLAVARALATIDGVDLVED